MVYIIEGPPTAAVVSAALPVCLYVADVKSAGVAMRPSSPLLTYARLALLLRTSQKMSVVSCRVLGMVVLPAATDSGWKGR